VEALCGSAPIELLEAADEELRRDQAEAIRVAYVAATRARDLLVVPVCGDYPIEGWLEVLDRCCTQRTINAGTPLGHLAALPLARRAWLTAARGGHPLPWVQSDLACIDRGPMGHLSCGGPGSACARSRRTGGAPPPADPGGR